MPETQTIWQIIEKSRPYFDQTSDLMNERYLSSTRRIKIDARALEVGMFVCDLDRPWIDSPFLLQGFLLKTDQDVETVRKVCDYVYVDATKSTLKDGQRPDEFDSGRINPPIRESFERAFPRAARVYEQSHALIKSTMDDIRLGKAIDAELAKGAVQECVDSIINNPNTLLLLSRIRNKDEYTSRHSLNVCVLSIALGRYLGLRSERLEELGLCGLLHDIGKVKIPNEILNKNERLTPNEFDVMKMHATFGRDILLSTPGLPSSVVDVAQNHHERIDGTGYPRGLDSEGTSRFTKMISVVDTYDSITSDRIYQKGESHLNALNILTRLRGAHYASRIVINFIACIGVYPPGSLIEFQNGEVAIVFEVTPETKTKPKVLLVLDRFKRPCKEKVLDLSKHPVDPFGQEYKIKEVLPHNTHGIDIKRYIERGLMVKGGPETIVDGVSGARP